MSEKLKVNKPDWEIKISRELISLPDVGWQFLKGTELSDLDHNKSSLSSMNKHHLLYKKENITSSFESSVSLEMCVLSLNTQRHTQIAIQTPHSLHFG